MKENYRRFTCTRAGGGGRRLRLQHHQDPRRPQLRAGRGEKFLADKKIGPLEGFRSKAGWPFTAELKLAFDDEIKNWKLEFDFGEDAKALEEGEPVDFSAQESLGACPKCQGHVYEHGANYLCEHSVALHITCDFKTGKIILQQPVSREEVHKLLTTGKTSLLENFVSNKTKRKFKAFLGLRQEGGQGELRIRAAGGEGAGEEDGGQKSACLIG